MRHLTSLVLIALLTACSTLGGRHESYAVYAPRSAPGTRSDAKPVAWQLLVQTPIASDALNTDRIAVMPSAGVFQVYPHARWRDPAPKLVQGLLIQAFEDSGRIVGVAGADSGLHADFMLALELRSFEIEYADGAPHAMIRLTAKLVDYSSSRVLATRAFAADVPAAGSSAADAASGIGQALNHLLPEVVAWTFAQGNSALAQHAPASAHGAGTLQDRLGAAMSLAIAAKPARDPSGAAVAIGERRPIIDLRCGETSG
ncbi:MAG: ABC-type transport auxiliary lipoprotein family protein [Rhodanobacteraceae bacterium]